LHRTQCSWCGHPLFCKLSSAVRIFSWIRIQVNTLHLFSPALSKCGPLGIAKEPLNWIKEPLNWIR
jgi:hypothetical protein